ncbi:hypothetical protein SAMN04487911_10323 [Arenibacter nanhaiticus]|uniref:DUF3325 domain-containing protein n=1 Tax=Arenibacter nanhaiticus TaxID=558155 RepID=A0A1M6BZJ2_9FLAO|nr:hypothetical protein SAMN04487911_10323 [Arenibacter nanhaiticus]
MVTLAICFTFIGFYLNYLTSKRAQLTNDFLLVWAKQKPKRTKISGLLLLLLGLTCTVYCLGWTSGLLSYSVILMTFGSLIVLVSPLHFFTLKRTVILALVLFLIEINQT